MAVRRLAALDDLLHEAADVNGRLGDAGRRGDLFPSPTVRSIPELAAVAGALGDRARQVEAVPGRRRAVPALHIAVRVVRIGVGPGRRYGVLLRRVVLVGEGADAFLELRRDVAEGVVGDV